MPTQMPAAALIRRRVVAAVLATFALAWGVIAYDGSMGATTTTATASTQTASTSSATSSSDASSASTTDDDDAAVTTAQS
jgi:hypothetical protein